MNLPPEVMAQWPQALANYGHPWKPGQRCGGAQPNYDAQHPYGRVRIYESGVVCEHGEIADHDTPPPAVTDELLWQMLVKGLEHSPWFLVDKIGPFLGVAPKNANDFECTRSLAAAVILAWASMEAK
jgi:hypothetical protein